MEINESLLEIKEYGGDGYMPMIDYGNWRVAILKYCDELLPENIIKMQKHNDTDEVFVLLKGKFILYIGDGDDMVENVYAKELQPLKMYNVKKATWHTHSLSEDAVVLIIENQNTELSNSPETQLTLGQRGKIIELSNVKAK
ncbi:hypothetical protein G9F72_012845 [Clostridium estertheticum]|uniref:hypothetical protein n=1 Tax=Clostridium estertheticum TaxID=238834 RepID=UPI001CD1745A|nr:hypothetical protein [Clostridium estertheticum]MBZ9687213.1 hypothetical protein [Clostridium estertheticum]